MSGIFPDQLRQYRAIRPWLDLTAASRFDCNVVTQYRAQRLVIGALVDRDQSPVLEAFWKPDAVGSRFDGRHR